MTRTPPSGPQSGTASPRQAVARPDERYQLFLATSLALALGLGFVLAILLPLALSLEAHWGLRWQALAQVHGHTQVEGFAGFFVLGMAYRLVPRFSGSPLRNPWTMLPVYVLLLAGLLLRALAQPLNDHPILAWGTAVASWCELGGAALFCLSILPTLVRPLRGRQPWAPFLAGGAVWFLLQALFGAWFLTDLWLHGSPINGLPGGRTILPVQRDGLLVALQFYGFLLGFIFGVSLRSVPTFFAYRPSPRLLLASWALLQAGLVLFGGEALLEVVCGSQVIWMQGAGLLCLGLALLGVATSTGSWREAERLRASARGAAGLLKAAFFWCAIAGLLNLAFGLQAWIEGRGLAGGRADAVRHVLAVGVVTTLIAGMGHLVVPALAIGVVTTLIAGMGHLVVPALATQRLAGLTARRRLLALQVLLAAAVLLRTAPLIGGLESRLRDGLIGAAGVLAWLAIALFAIFLWRARAQQAGIIAEVTELTPRRSGQDGDGEA